MRLLQQKSGQSTVVINEQRDLVLKTKSSDPNANSITFVVNGFILILDVAQLCTLDISCYAVSEPCLYIK